MIYIPKWLAVIMMVVGVITVLVIFVSGSGEGGAFTFILALLYFAIPLYVLLKEDNPNSVSNSEKKEYHPEKKEK